jgi:carbamoyl-phosphate synthase large subunit
MIGRGDVSLVINTPEGSGPFLDSRSIRLVANELKVPTFTTIAAAAAAVDAIAIVQSGELLEVRALQDYHQLTR